MNKTEFTAEFEPILTEMGFKKENSAWILFSDGVDVVVHIQDIVTSSDNFFINFGIYLIDIGNAEIPSISDCQIFKRLNSDTNNLESITSELKRWIDYYGDINRLRIKVFEHKMPVVTSLSVYAYFRNKRL